MPQNLCHFCGSNAICQCQDCKIITCNYHNYCRSGCREEVSPVPTGSVSSSPDSTPPYPWSDSE